MAILSNYRDSSFYHLQDFNELYTLLCQLENPTPQQVDDYFVKVYLKLIPVYILYIYVKESIFNLDIISFIIPYNPQKIFLRFYPNKYKNCQYGTCAAVSLFKESFRKTQVPVFILNTNTFYHINVFYLNKQASKWVTLFQSLGGVCPGYEKARVTPYMHAMVFHVPRFMTLHQGMKKFTGQGKLYYILILLILP